MARISPFQKLLLPFAFIIYLITAFNSEGYFHFDEHYQIIEFANLKLGINTPSDLAWEYQVLIRPAIQPAVCVIVFKVLQGIGISDVYTLALSLRLLTLLISLTAITLFVHSSLHLVAPKNKKLYIVLSYFLWFLPFLNVRFSSETWSGSLFLLATAILHLNVSKRKRLFVLTGVLLGISFLCRFQSAFLIVGLLGWHVIILRESIKNISIITGATCITLLAGFAIDWWFYETPVFTFWNYFNINILQGVASSFGTLPWHYYIGTILGAPIYPIGCLIFICLFILIYKKPALYLVWVIVPFLIVHSIIPHKEDRFLFPLINFIPLVIILGWQEIKVHKKPYRLAAYVLLGILSAINLLALTVMASRPMGNGTKAITHYVHKHYRNKPVNLIYDTYKSPYNPLYLVPLKEPFYADDNVNEILMQELLKKDSKPINKDETILFVFEKNNVDYPDINEIIKKYNLRPKIQSIPEWVEYVSKYNNYLNDQSVLLLYGNN